MRASESRPVAREAWLTTICDADGRMVDYRFLTVNPAFERMTGVKAEDIVGRTALESFFEFDPLLIENFGGVARTGEPFFFDKYYTHALFL